nr:Eaf7 domain-containing protein [Ipomoea batatas]
MIPLMLLHLIICALIDSTSCSFNKHFTADDVLKLLDRFYNLEMLKADDDEGEILNQEEEFSLPQSYFSKEES